MQMGPAAAITPEDAVQHSITLRIGLQQYPAGAIAKNDTGGPIGIIDNAAHLIGAKHNDLPATAALDIHRAAGESIQKSRTGGAHIKAPGILRTHLVTDDIGCRGE